MVALNTYPEFSLPQWTQYWKGKGGSTDVVLAQDVNDARAPSLLYKQRALGTEVLVDRQGLVAFRAHIPAKEKDLRAEVDKLTGPLPTVGSVVLSTIGTVQVYPDQGNQHFSDDLTISQSGYPPYLTEYRTDPPVSGAHWSSLAPPGVHLATQPDELLLHNLAHGYVIIHYNCPGFNCWTQLLALKQIVDRYPSKVILHYRPQTRTRIALAAWTRLDLIEPIDVAAELDEARIVNFIETYRGKIGPEADAEPVAP